MIFHIFTFMFIKLKETMKIKASILLITGIMVSINAFSQIKFGLTAGTLISSTNISCSGAGTISSGVTNDFQIESSSDRVGLQGGIVAQIKLGDMFIQPGIILSGLNSKIKISYLANKQTNIYLYQHYTNLSVPVIVGYKVGMFRFGVGPVANFILQRDHLSSLKFTSSSSDLTESIKFKYHIATIDYQFDLGVDVWKLAFDLKFQGNASKLGNGMTINDGTESAIFTFDTRVNQWSLGVGYFF